MSLNVVSAGTSHDLLATLRATDISVPLRTDGRKTDHTETWVAARLLSTLTAATHISFPVAIVHREKPDFLCHFGASEIGIEVTEAVSKSYAAYCALAEREFPGVFLDPGHFRWGEPDMPVGQMRKLLRENRLTSEGWAGDRPEQEWALFIQSAIAVKAAKLARPDFDKFEQNWLAIYDNLPLPHVYLAKAVEFLMPLLHEGWTRQPRFDAIFIEHGPVIVRVTQTGSKHLRVNDLWS